MHYLDLVPVTDEAIEHSNRTEGLLSFDDFVSRMIKIGFGKKVFLNPPQCMSVQCSLGAP